MTSPKTTEGFVYLVINEHFPGWVKVGKATDASRRLRQYQTGDPTRSYRLHLTLPTPNRHHTEHVVMERLKGLGFLRVGEWFEVSVETAEAALRASAAEGVPDFLDAPAQH